MQPDERRLRRAGRLKATLGRAVRWMLVSAVLCRTDVNIVRLAGRASYHTLLEAGVRVYEWQPSTLHAKTFVVDGEWLTIGPMNFDNRSMALNDEATLMVLDRTVGEQMDRIFINDLGYAAEITAAQFGQRSLFQRMAEQGANLITRLL
jgi:cardiolipin synthase